MTPATERLLTTVDRLTTADLAGPSLLPTWSRAHVVAHLALNAEALARGVRGATAGEPVSTYDSAAVRDDDIAALAAGDPDLLVPRLRAACTALVAALDALPQDRAGTGIERTPGSGPSYTAGAVAFLRLREVEIHHADLDAGYTRADWPEAFCRELVTSEASRHVDRPFGLRASDVQQHWPAPAGRTAPTVTGTAADLGWWLTGRGSGAGLTSDDGVLPSMETW